MAYVAEKPHPNPSADELRRRIPGWGADLDPADRPSFPRERRVEPLAGHGGTVGGVEVSTPTGDAVAQLVAALGERGLVRCVGHDELLQVTPRWGRRSA